MAYSLHTIKYLLLPFLFAFFTTTSYAGGPWLLAKYSGFYQLQTTISAYPYSKLLTGLAIKDSRGINREVYTIDYGFYGEYGITNKLNLLASLPFKYAESGEVTEELHFPNLLEKGSINGLSNIRLGLKYGVLDNNLKIAISAQTILGTVSSDIEKGLITGFDGNAFGLFTHIGGSINDKWYTFAELGYLKWTNNFSDIIEGKIEIGRKLGKSFTLMLSTDIRQSLENGSYFNEDLVQTGLFPNDQEWIVAGIKLNYQHTNNLGLNFGMPLIPIQFNNVGFAGAFSLGVYYQM